MLPQRRVRETLSAAKEFSDEAGGSAPSPEDGMAQCEFPLSGQVVPQVGRFPADGPPDR